MYRQRGQKAQNRSRKERERGSSWEGIPLQGASGLGEGGVRHKEILWGVLERPHAECMTLILARYRSARQINTEARGQGRADGNRLIALTLES